MSIVQDVLNVVGIQLQDPAAVKWTSANSILYFNLASKEICTIKPDAYSQIIIQELVSGSQQELAANVIDLLDVTFNMDYDGITQGAAIRPIDKKRMDFLLPGWPDYPSSQGVYFAVIDDENPRYFYVFPPNSGGQNVQLLVAIMPPLVDYTTDTIALDDSYFQAYVDYIIARSLMEETTVPGSLAKGQAYMQKFMTDLGIKKVVEKEEKVEENVEMMTSQGRKGAA